jgi:hypothetical protein
MRFACEPQIVTLYKLNREAFIKAYGEASYQGAMLQCPGKKENGDRRLDSLEFDFCSLMVRLVQRESHTF